MKPSLRKELEQVFEAPPPLRKKEFLRRSAFPGMNTAEFVFSQAGYIRRRIWAVFAGVFGISLAGSMLLSADMLWAISAFAPLLALGILSESGRSERFEMAELETATRFSLRSVLLARLGILGTADLALLCLLIPVGVQNNMLTPLQAGVYITTPFLLTTFIGLYIVRRLRSRGAIYLCAGSAACVSLSVLFCRQAFPQIYQPDQLAWWAAGILLLTAGTAKQYHEMIAVCAAWELGGDSYGTYD